jgi:hypothetical protein
MCVWFKGDEGKEGILMRGKGWKGRGQGRGNF